LLIEDFFMLSNHVRRLLPVCLTALAVCMAPVAAKAQVTGFMQSVAEMAAKDRSLATFYKDNGYEAIFTGADDASRRGALLKVLARVRDHGLPVARYDVATLEAAFETAKSARDRGRAEVLAASMFVAYARDVHSGVLTPSRIDEGMVRKVTRRDPVEFLEGLVAGDPDAFLRSLAPTAPEYARLMKAKLRLEARVASGGWGAGIADRKLEPGDSGTSVVELRNRLIRMGYLDHSISTQYDGTLQAAVQQFQIDHGLAPDGVAGTGTITEINRPAETRLEQVVVAMERERWLNKPRGDRHVLVNITDFTAKIVDDGKVTFQTRSVVGANTSDRRTPEFSDIMEHMVVNPTWNVPRSIATKEYLPMFQKDPNAAAHLNLLDGAGRLVSRADVDFSTMTAKNFPFDVKQPPSRSNALGLVKFMFPNRHNIYLHDTPAKSLFSRERRAFSHGCVRLSDPFDFAYALLAVQEENPKAVFQRVLATGRETTLPLKIKVPVHLIYRTAFTQAKGRINFRPDVYGRDAKVFRALEDVGVELGAVGS
jgi:murein L,D-transpeptidase YcbB/YkuD